MTVTDLDLKPETILNPWQDFPRGAKWIRNPLDVMFDIDDVIFPTMMSIHELARQAGYHDNDVDPSWCGWEPYKVPEQAYWDLWSDFALSGGYTATEPIPGTIEAMRRLYFEGHRIHLVTARGFMNHANDIRTWTADWVEEFGVPWHSLTFARDKVGAMHNLADEFAPASVWPFFDYAIDDSPKNIEHLRDAGVRAYLLDHVHNKDHHYSDRIPSVDTFVDMILQEETRA